MGAAIVAMVLGFALIVVKMGLDHEKAKLLAKGDSGPGSTMLMSELEEMIQLSVAEAVKPLQERIDELETLQLAEGQQKRQLSAPETDPSEVRSTDEAL